MVLVFGVRSLVVVWWREVSVFSGLLCVCLELRFVFVMVRCLCLSVLFSRLV